MKKEYLKYALQIVIVIFLGFQSNVSSYVNLFDINLNCSIGTETSSLAISEGLSLGKVVLASDYGGNPNMVINGQTGFIFKQNDAKKLGELILFLKNNPDTLHYMSEQAKEDFQRRFSAGNMAEQYAALYRDIMRKK